MTIELLLFSLDPALIRPGRVDFKQFIGPLTAYQVELMLMRFYPQATRDQVDQFLVEIAKISENYQKDLSAAQLQGFFMHNKESLQHVFDHLKQLS